MRRLLAEHRCPGCEIRKDLCFCAEIPRVELQTQVMLLMHTAEEVLTSNTARLTAQALTNCELRIRGRKDAPMSPEGLQRDDRTSLLLYPSPHAAELNAEFVAGLTKPAVLIVPDGSWVQTKRFVRRDPAFVGMQHVKLPPGPPSIYRLRRQVDTLGLCTLEAVARALGILESPTAQAKLERLLLIMVERTLWSRGALKTADSRTGIPSEALALRAPGPRRRPSAD
ncbi:MAG: DTW domain-containing protein [Pirellula sp.]|nr:DTW domain-containing protein [Pirellula sp.]